MLPFKKLTLEDIPAVAECLKWQDYRTSDYSVAGIYMWEKYLNTEYCIVKNMLYVKMISQTQTPYFCMPVGSGKIDEAIQELRKHCQETGHDLLFAAVPEQAVTIIEEKLGKPASIDANRDWFDYLYLAEDLAAIKGKKFRTQRNHINKFIRSYSDFNFVKIDHSNISRVRDFYAKYVQDNPPESRLSQFESEAVIKYLNEYYDKFASLGYYLEVHSQIIGFCLGEIVNDTLFVHIEKASLDWHGSYQMLVNQFALKAPEGIKYFNREEDVGIEGLRQSKMSYNPLCLLKKHTMKYPLDVL